MIEKLGELIDLIYIEGYFEKGTFNQEEFKAKPFFVLNLLKGCVAKPDQIIFTKSAINGYIGGNSIDSVVKDIKEAGYDKLHFSNYIEKLYAKKHKNTKTYNERYGDKTYKEALYEKVNKKFPNIGINNMSSFLASNFDSIITAITDADIEKTTLSGSAMSRSNTISSYIINADEKSAIKNICSELKRSIITIKSLTDNIDKKRHEATNLEEAENNQLFRKSLEFDLKALEQQYTKAFSNFEKLYSDLRRILMGKEHVSPCIKTICDTVSEINNDTLNILNPDFQYNSFSLMVSNLTKQIKNLLDIIDKL